MKVKTSITLIEKVLRHFRQQRRYATADARDLRGLNRNAAQLNPEAAEVREYQAPWPED